MESFSVRQGDLAHNTPLFLDFLYRFEKVAPFYDYRPFRADEFARAAAAMDYPDERRRALVRALRGENGDSPSLELLARPGTVAVTTGQQVGLFSGPAYTIYKALTAAKTARQLREQGLPAVAVFWMATEDHDFDEVNHCWVYDRHDTPVKLDSGGAAGGQRPVGLIPLAHSPLAELRAALAEFPFADQIGRLVAEAYAPGRTFGQAFHGLLKLLLAKYDLIFLDPLRAEIRQIAAPLLGRAAEAAPELTAALLERGRLLVEAGYHAQVHVEPRKPPLFLLENGRRLALQEGQLEAARDRAGELSPNALLRPVVADYLMPTVATVLGPAEVAYMAQSQVLYRALSGRAPVIVPRGSFTILDARAAALMERFKLGFGDLLEGEEALRERLGRVLTPPEMAEVLRHSRTATAESLDRLREVTTGFDPTLAQATDKSRAKMLYQLSKIERKVARETARRDERADRQAAALARLVYPHKHLQERFYSILPFLARHGLDLLDRLYENVRIDCPDHRVLVV